jgi:tagatose 6-phosphate kinase
MIGWRADPQAVTVTANVALDVTYELPVLQLGATNRVSRVHRRAGGKGLNVARVLQTIGMRVAASGAVGGAMGQLVRHDLAGSGIADELISVGAETRLTVAIVEQQDGGTTLLNEPGLELTPVDRDQLTARVRALLDHQPAPKVLVLSGSLAPGTPSDLYAELVDEARHRDVPVVVDTSGAALAEAVSAGPDLVTPTLEELAGVLDLPEIAWENAGKAAQSLLEQGVKSVVVTNGAAGALAIRQDRSMLARPPRVEVGNPTGAGDALAAALASALAHGADVLDALPAAVALAASAVNRPYAGEVDQQLARSLPWLPLVPASPGQ